MIIISMPLEFIESCLNQVLLYETHTFSQIQKLILHFESIEQNMEVKQSQKREHLYIETVSYSNGYSEANQ